MIHFIESLISNVIEIGVGVTAGIVFREPILTGVAAVKKKITG